MEIPKILLVEGHLRILAAVHGEMVEGRLKILAVVRGELVEGRLKILAIVVSLKKIVCQNLCKSFVKICVGG